ncbi:hypothetical protein AVEN_50425-1 [Araneus ventricosus]|uniref:ATP-dependent DNA helicase PIF1 n=1 Tax=Araneus ventricosus TaxID=182803 RepID=A0A4Y2ETJ7_ARAVE|nr:hypothetical protein AVEN_50425-1 [Araneus ventricosus]
MSLPFPVKVCHAMTINKAQGKSLKIVGVDLRTDCFTHSQVYATCSGVSPSDSLVILQSEVKTANVEYKEVFNTFQLHMEYTYHKFHVK